MNYILDILIFKSDFDKVNITEQFGEWEGEKFSQVPPKYVYKSILEFHENSDSYYQKVLAEVDLENYVPLTLENQYLSELESIVNSDNHDIRNNELILFLTNLYNNLSTFFVFMFRDEESIDEICHIRDSDELVEAFCKSLSRKSPKGVILIKHN